MDYAFHYYGTYCAAREAGFSSNDSWVIAHAAQFVDECSKDILKANGIDDAYPTFHKTSELMEMNSGFFGSPFPVEIPKVWTSFHFLPGNYTEENLYRVRFHNEKYINNSVQPELFKLLCLPYSFMAGQIVDKAKECYNVASNVKVKKLTYIGIVMHVLADTFAHEYFVGTPSKAINEASWITEISTVSELKPYGLSNIRETKKVSSSYYVYSPAFSETSVGWLGHGRVGTYPDIANKKYYYTPAWNGEAECIKDNPLLHLCAFQQMVDAMKFILDSKNVNKFDYKKELSSDEYNSDYNKKISAILNSDGNDKDQQNRWAEHILTEYNEGVRRHDANALAQDTDFLKNFVNNAETHRVFVCKYCDDITSDEVKYFK